MASVNRAALITKTHRILKKYYKPSGSYPKETLLDNLLFACCLENALPEQAELAFQSLKERFFDLNEVRVSTIRELAEVMQVLPDADGAALRIKSLLQSIFEALYSFDLETLKKQNLGAATKTLQKYDGTSPFAIAYITQVSLGGHAIPVNNGALQAMIVLGVVTEAEAKKDRVPGLERAISKNKGLEFGSLLHQLGVAMTANPYSPNVRKVLLEIDEECKARLPKRPVKKPEAEAVAAAPVEPPAATPPPVEKAEKSTKKSAAKPESAKAEPAKSAPAKSEAPKKKAAVKEPPAKEAAAKKKVPAKKAPPAAAPKKQPPVKKKQPPVKKKTSAAPPATKKKPAPAKKPAAKGLTKKKPK